MMSKKLAWIVSDIYILIYISTVPNKYTPVEHNSGHESDSSSN